MSNDNLYKILFLSIIALIPAYIFPSGGFQLVDIPLVLFILLIVLDNRNKNGQVSELKYFIPFLSWAIIINGFYCLFNGNISSLYGLAPIVYAPIIFYTFKRYFMVLIQNRKISLIYWAIFLSIIITFSVKGATIQDSDRALLSFNDPNQLGYFATILLGYVIFLSKVKGTANINDTVYYIFDGLIIVLAHYYLLLSVSRSAMGAIIILDLCLIKNVKNIKNIFSIIIFLLITVLFIVYINPDFIQQREAARGEDKYSKEEMVQDFKGRALGPLRDMGARQILVGVGQGRPAHNMGLLQEGRDYKESHNLFFEILRGYGIIGLILFLFWLLKALWMSRLFNDGLWVWAGLLTFNMGNYGFRWRGFWILLGFLFAIMHYTKQEIKVCHNYDSNACHHGARNPQLFSGTNRVYEKTGR